ncbi:MAG: CBS domain-containing protein, partial [Bacillota bacterium]|nr:CBS domain-containing protein [Bacillota bacterium]
KRLENDVAAVPVAEDLMIQKLVTSKPTRGLAEALKIMRTYRVDSLLVTDNENKLLGIVPIENVQRYFGEEDKTLRDILNINYSTVERTTPYTDVAEIFAKEGVTSIPVLDQGKLAGLITRATMMRGLAGIDTEQKPKGGHVNV